MFSGPSGVCFFISVFIVSLSTNLFLSKLPLLKYCLILLFLDAAVYLSVNHFRIFVSEGLLRSVLCPFESLLSLHFTVLPVGAFLESSVVSSLVPGTEN